MARGFTPTNGSQAEASWARSLERRIEILESETRLFRASVKGGAIVAYTDELDQVVRLGTGVYGTATGNREASVFAANNAEGSFHMLIDMEEGLVVPKIPIYWSPNDYVSVTDSDWVVCYKSVIIAQSQVLRVSAVVAADSGTVGEARLRINYATSSDVYNIPAATVNGYSWSWDVSEILRNSALAYLTIEVRRVSGADSVHCYAPDLGYMDTISNSPDATSGGTPST